jgi:hypothetical protein
MGSEGFKLACHLGREALFQGFHFGVYGRIHFGIDGGNIVIYFPHFLLSHREIKFQGIEALFKFLVMGVGHGERGEHERCGWDHI